MYFFFTAMRRLNSIPGSGFTFLLILLCACKREDHIVDKNAQPDSSWLSITNASPSIPNLLFYENNTFISFPDSPFSFGSTTSGSYVINSGNPVMSTMINHLRMVTRLYEATNLADRLVPDSTEHLAIVDALEAGDSRGARQKAQSHIRSLYKASI